MNWETRKGRRQSGHAHVCAATARSSAEGESIARARARPPGASLWMSRFLRHLEQYSCPHGRRRGLVMSVMQMTHSGTREAAATALGAVGSAVWPSSASVAPDSDIRPASASAAGGRSTGDEGVAGVGRGLPAEPIRIARDSSSARAAILGVVGGASPETMLIEATAVPVHKGGGKGEREGGPLARTWCPDETRMNCQALGRAATMAAAITVLLGACGAGERKPWDLGRFVSTAATFNSPIDAVARALSGPSSATVKAPGSVIWSPTEPGEMTFAPLDDVVMGGCSESSVDLTEDGLLWTGTVTTANNGGFTGMRTKTFARPLDLSACQGISLRVRADAFTYKCILRDSADWNGIAWTASFKTTASSGEQTIRLPFSSFVATKFARTVPSAPLNLSSILAVQFSLSKFEYDGGLNPTFREGPFGLTLLDIRCI